MPIEFAKNNPQAHIGTELRRAKHPFVRATYLSGKSKTIGVKNLSVEDIEKMVKFLQNQKGFKVHTRHKKYTNLHVLSTLASIHMHDTPSHLFFTSLFAQVTSYRYRKPVQSLKPSIQGEWHELLELHNMKVELEHKN